MGMSRFLEEICQQPSALRQLLAFYRAEGRGLLEAAAGMCGMNRRRLIFTGMGSSCFAPLAVRFQLIRAGIETEVWEAAELLHYGHKSCTENAAVVAVSQSGESIETRRAADSVRESSKLVAITNRADSHLAGLAEVVLPMVAGAEASISTKTYSNTLALLHLLAAVLSERDMNEAHEALEHVADGMDGFLREQQEEMAEAARFLEGAPFLYFIARGPALAAAYQGALTFNEGARLPTCALSGGAFRHGPFELSGREFAAVFLAPRGRTWEITTGMACEVAESGGRVLLLTEETPAKMPRGIRAVKLEDFGEELFPLNACIPIELLLCRMARQRGLEAGIFERITKVTLRE